MKPNPYDWARSTGERTGQEGRDNIGEWARDSGRYDWARGKIRKTINKVAHKRATTVARAKALPSKPGQPIPAHFVSTGTRTATT